MSANNTPTPPEVELVRSFLNTAEIGDGVEALDSPASLGLWLAQAGLIEPGTPASGRDLQLALRLRAALRAEVVRHHDRLDDPTVVAALDEVCCELPLRAACGPEALVPAGSGVRGALAQLAAAATTARIKGTWGRLKICPAEDCAWAFYDTSRNRSKRWCSMDVCGNRSKVRAFRDRAH